MKNVHIFEQDSYTSRTVEGGLTEQWIDDYLNSPDDEFSIIKEHEDYKVVIYQAVAVEEGESYKFIGIK